MTVRVEKPEFNLRDKLSQLDRRVGSMGGEILASKSPKEVQGLIGVGSRNMIINGGMKIAQRGTSSTLNGSSGLQYPCCDRWGGQFSTPNSTFTVSQSTDAPVGHSHSLKFLTNSAVTVDGNHYYWIGQRIEGLNFAQSGWNASASGRTETAQPCTLSFWVKSSLPGKWCAAVKGLNNHTNSYLIVYEIKKPDTWEWKTHTIYPSPEITNWNYDTSAAMAIQFDVGTSRIGDLGTNVIGEWQNHNSYTYNNDKFIPSRIHGIAGATWYLTGVQFEPGPVATPFEHRSYGEELALCQRYFYRAADGASKALGLGVNYTASEMHCAITFPVTMRESPTLSAASGTNYYEFIRNGGADWFNSFTRGNRTNTKIGEIYNNSQISGTVGHGGYVRTDNAAVFVDFDAEL